MTLARVENVDQGCVRRAHLDLFSKNRELHFHQRPASHCSGIKASSVQRLLILSKRLHCERAFWLHCAEAPSILRSTCTTFWLKWPAVHQIGCWHFHWSQKTSCAESNTSSAVCAQGSHHSYKHHTGLHSIYLRFRETSCKHLLLKCFTEVLEGEKRHLHGCWTLFGRNLSIFDIDCIMYVQIQRLFFPHAFKALHCFCYCAQLPARLAVHPECVCASVCMCISCTRKYFPCAEICACHTHTKMVVVHFTRTTVTAVRGYCSVLRCCPLCWMKWTCLPHSC